MDRIGNWQQTFTGRQFWPLDPRPEDVMIEDVAHALSMVCRFGGHCREFYSVAQHSVIVSHAVERYAGGRGNPAVQLWGLLHDAAEAYIGDIIRPIKPYLTGYAEIESKIMEAVLQRFGLFETRPTMPGIVKICDDRACATEARDLMVSPPAMWWANGTAPEPFENVIYPWSSAVAEGVFLDQFHELTEAL